MPNKDNLPLYFEELKLKEENKVLTLQELIAQFKQSIPFNYLKINFEEGNYGGSTNPKWKNKPLCERYFFTYEGKEIQLDIPYDLMDKLGLKKGQDLTQPLYLDPQVLERTETYKGITIQEGEIILVNPNKITLKDQEIQTEPNEEEFKRSKEELTKLEKKLSEKNKKIEELETKLKVEALTDQERGFLKEVDELYKMGSQPVFNLNNLPQPLWDRIRQGHTTLQAGDKLIKIATVLGWRMAEIEQEHNKLKSKEAELVQKNTQINNLIAQVNSLQVDRQQINNLQSQLNIINSELAKERGWWDKWMLWDLTPIDGASIWVNTDIGKVLPHLGISDPVWYSVRFINGTLKENGGFNSSINSIGSNGEVRKIIKVIYQYLRDR